MHGADGRAIDTVVVHAFPNDCVGCCAVMPGSAVPGAAVLGSVVVCKVIAAAVPCRIYACAGSRVEPYLARPQQSLLR